MTGTDKKPPIRQKKQTRPAWRRWTIRVLAVPAAVGLIDLGVTTWLGTDTGRAWLAGTLSDVLDSPGADVTVRGFSGHAFGRFRLEGVTIRDTDGVWFKADALRLAWRPFALLRGTLAVSSLDGDGLHLGRLPVASAPAAPETAAPADTGGPLGSLPVAVELDRLALAFTYGRAADQYRLDGSGLALNHAHLTGHVGLESARGDDKLKALLDWQAPKRTLAVDLTLDAAPHGLLGSLFGLGDLGVLKADLHGAGALSAWKGSFRIKAGAAFTSDGTVKGSAPESGGGHLSLIADVTHALALSPALGGVLGSHLTLKADMDFGTGTPASFALDLKSGSSHASLAGAVDADGRVEHGVLSVTAPMYDAGPAVGGLKAEDAKLAGQFTLAWPSFKLDYVLTAAHAAGFGAVGDGLAFKGGVELDQYHAGGDVSSMSMKTLALEGVSEGGAAPLHTTLSGGSGTWDVRRSDGAWRVDNVMVNTGIGSLSRLKAAGTPEGGVGDLSVDASLNSAFIDHLAPGIVTKGHTDMRLIASAADPGAGNVPGALSIDYALEGQDIGWTNDDLATLVGATPRILGHMVMAPGGAISGGTVRLAGAYLSGAGGNISLKDGAVRADVSVDIEGRAPFFADTAFALPTGVQVAGHVSGPVAHPALQLQSELTSAEGYGAKLADVKAVLKLLPDAADKAGWHGSFGLSATSAAGPVNLGTDVTLGDGLARLTKIAFTAPAVKAEGQALWSANHGLDMTLSARMTPVDSKAFTLDGTATAIMTLGGKPGAMKGKLTLMAGDVALALPGHFPIQLKTLQGRVGFGGDPGGYEADIKLAHLHYGAQQLDTLTLAGDTSTGDGIRLKADGYIANAFTADAVVKPTDAGAALSFTADYGGIAFKTGEPISLGWDGGLTATAPALAVGAGSARLDGRYTRAGLDATASLKAIPLELVNTVRAGMFKDGTLDADISLHRATRTGAGADAAKVQASLKNVRFFTDTLTGSDASYSLDAGAELKDGRLTLDASATAAGQQVGTVTGSVPVERATPGFYAIRPGAPVSMAVNWYGDVAPLWLLARRPDHLLEGTLKGRLTLSGDLENPVFDGSLALEDGRYEYETLGLVAGDLKLDLTGDNRAVVLKSLTANDGNGGTLTGHGSFELSPKLSFPGTLMVSLKDYHMARLDSLDGRASADLVYKRGSAEGSLSGTITTGTINFILPKELPTSVVDIDVTEVGVPEEMEGPSAIQLAKRKPTNLDVKIGVPGHLFVRGRGLESEWEGALQVSGTTAVPRLAGAMTLRSGTFMLGGREFTIDSGSLSFRGGRRIDPDIDVSATYQTTGLEAVLKISGPVSAPKFSLSSTPMLAEDEILSRILFGRSVADLTPLQIAQVAVALNGLRGSNAFDVVGQLRRQLGLDKLSIGPDDDDEGGGALLTGGKYLRDNVYLEVETSTATAQAVARLKVNITKRFLAESEMGPKRGSSLKIKWFWEY